MTRMIMNVNKSRIFKVDESEMFSQFSQSKNKVLTSMKNFPNKDRFWQ